MWVYANKTMRKLMKYDNINHNNHEKNITVDRWFICMQNL